MKYSEERLNAIYDKSSGRCHLCHKKVHFKNYGSVGTHGAWEVEHSNPQARGGTDRLSNLFAACISCNRSKGAGSTRSARAKNGKKRAPLSMGQRKAAKIDNAFLGGTAGFLLGAAINPAVAVLGTLFGAAMGHNHNPDR